LPPVTRSMTPFLSHTRCIYEVYAHGNTSGPWPWSPALGVHVHDNHRSVFMVHEYVNGSWWAVSTWLTDPTKVIRCLHFTRLNYMYWRLTSERAMKRGWARAVRSGGIIVELRTWHSGILTAKSRCVSQRHLWLVTQDVDNHSLTSARRPQHSVSQSSPS